MIVNLIYAQISRPRTKNRGQPLLVKPKTSTVNYGMGDHRACKAKTYI